MNRALEGDKGLLLDVRWNFEAVGYERTTFIVHDRDLGHLGAVGGTMITMICFFLHALLLQACGSTTSCVWCGDDDTNQERMGLHQMILHVQLDIQILDA